MGLGTDSKKVRESVGDRVVLDRLYYNSPHVGAKLCHKGGGQQGQPSKTVGIG